MCIGCLDIDAFNAQNTVQLAVLTMSGPLVFIKIFHNSMIPFILCEHEIAGLYNSLCKRKDVLFMKNRNKKIFLNNGKSNFSINFN